LKRRMGSTVGRITDWANAKGSLWGLAQSVNIDARFVVSLISLAAVCGSDFKQQDVILALPHSCSAILRQHSDSMGLEGLAQRSKGERRDASVIRKTN